MNLNYTLKDKLYSYSHISQTHGFPFYGLFPNNNDNADRLVVVFPSF